MNKIDTSALFHKLCHERVTSYTNIILSIDAFETLRENLVRTLSLYLLSSRFINDATKLYHYECGRGSGLFFIFGKMEGAETKLWIDFFHRGPADAITQDIEKTIDAAFEKQ